MERKIADYAKNNADLVRALIIEKKRATHLNEKLIEKDRRCQNYHLKNIELKRTLTIRDNELSVMRKSLINMVQTNTSNYTKTMATFGLVGTNGNQNVATMNRQNVPSTSQKVLPNVGSDAAGKENISSGTSTVSIKEMVPAVPKIFQTLVSSSAAAQAVQQETEDQNNKSQTKQSHLDVPGYNDIKRSPMKKKHEYDDEINQSLNLIKEKSLSMSLPTVQDENEDGIGGNEMEPIAEKSTDLSNKQNPKVNAVFSKSRDSLRSIENCMEKRSDSKDEQNMVLPRKIVEPKQGAVADHKTPRKKAIQATVADKTVLDVNGSKTAGGNSTTGSSTIFNGEKVRPTLKIFIKTSGASTSAIAANEQTDKPNESAKPKSAIEDNIQQNKTEIDILKGAEARNLSLPSTTSKVHSATQFVRDSSGMNTATEMHLAKESSSVGQASLSGLDRIEILTKKGKQSDLGRSNYADWKKRFGNQVSKSSTPIAENKNLVPPAIEKNLLHVPLSPIDYTSRMARVLSLSPAKNLASHLRSPAKNETHKNDEAMANDNINPDWRRSQNVSIRRKRTHSNNINREVDVEQRDTDRPRRQTVRVDYTEPKLTTKMRRED